MPPRRPCPTHSSPAPTDGLASRESLRTEAGGWWFQRPAIWVFREAIVRQGVSGEAPGSWARAPTQAAREGRGCSSKASALVLSRSPDAPPDAAFRESLQ